MNPSAPRRVAVAAAALSGLLAPAAGLVPAFAVMTEEPQTLPLTVADPGNTGTTVMGEVKPVPAKYVAATDVESVTLAVKMLPPAKGKAPVKTLVVRYRLGDVLPADTKGMLDQDVTIALHIPNDDDAYDYNQFTTTVAAPTRVGFFDGPSFGDGTKCGYARTNFNTDVIRQFIPIRKCVGAVNSEDAIVMAGIQLKPGSNDSMAYRAAWNDQIHTGPLSYDLP